MHNQPRVNGIYRYSGGNECCKIKIISYHEISWVTVVQLHYKRNFVHCICSSLCTIAIYTYTVSTYQCHTSVQHKWKMDFLSNVIFRVLWSAEFEISCRYCIYIGCENHGVHSSKTGYFVCGTSVSLCLLVQRTNKHSRHNSSTYAHFSGQARKHTCSFSPFQLSQRTSRVKSWTRKTEDSLDHWTSASQSFSCPVYI